MKDSSKGQLLSHSHLDRRGHGSALGQLDPSHRSLPVADVDVLIEDRSRDGCAVLCQRLQSQDCVLRDRQVKETDRSKVIQQNTCMCVTVCVCVYLYRVETLSIVLILGQPRQDRVSILDPPL